MAVVLLGIIYLLVSRLSVNYVQKDGELGLLEFGFSNIKQAMIIEFVFVLMLVLSFKIKTKEEVSKLLKVFAISTIFAIIWGLAQFITYYFKIPYPVFLFNNNKFATQCYMQIDNNVKRISRIGIRTINVCN